MKGNQIQKQPQNALGQKPTEMKSLQELALNLFNLSEIQLKQDRHRKRKQVDDDKQGDGGEQPGDKALALNLDLKSLQKTRQPSKELPLKTEEGEKEEQTLNMQQENLPKIYSQLMRQKSGGGLYTDNSENSSLSRSPKFRESSGHNEDAAQHEF